MYITHCEKSVGTPLELTPLEHQYFTNQQPQTPMYIWLVVDTLVGAVNLHNKNAHHFLAYQKKELFSAHSSCEGSRKLNVGMADTLQSFSRQYSEFFSLLQKALRKMVKQNNAVSGIITNHNQLPFLVFRIFRNPYQSH